MIRLIAALLVFVLAAPALAKPYVISFDGGGSIKVFYEKYQILRASSSDVVVDGPCISACTLVFGLVERDKVCITPRAIFGFHQGSESGEFSPDATGLLWYQYPSYVQQFLISKGWDGTKPQPDLIWMDNETARGWFRVCST